MARQFGRDLGLFAVTLAAIFLAELGDKTQLTALVFSANTPGYRLLIFLASGAALVLTSLLGILVGDLVGRVVKPRLLNIVAGAVFILCAGLFVLRFVSAGGASGSGAESVAEGRTPWEAFAFTFVMIFVAELGDKTQLATLSLAAGHRRARWVVFAGASAALVLAAGLACLVGGALGAVVRSGYLSLGAAAIFTVLGVAFLMGWAEKGRREFAWLVERIDELYEDERCRHCARFMEFLEHVRAMDSDIVSEKVAQRLVPREQWDEDGCCDDCRVDVLHRKWHERFEHADEAPGQEG